jgi:putative endonuclease
MYEKNPFVYIMASGHNGTIYVGVTSNLIQRVWKHKHDKKGFTGRYGVFDLVYYEAHTSMEYAIAREKQIKKWERQWKMKLIDEMNPEWRDLWKDILGSQTESSVDGAIQSEPPPAWE